MDAATRETWERFYDRVVVKGRNWPRSLWFAAVEDGLRAGLPAQSPLLAQYRQDVAELVELERAGTGAARVQQLEAEIKRLIAIADQTTREIAEQKATGGPARVGYGLGALALGIIMFCGALLGITYYQQQRASERMQLELAAVQQRLIEQAADQRSALEMRIRSVDRVKENLVALQDELRTNVDEFNRLMSSSLRSLSVVGGDAIADLERQVRDPGGDTGKAASPLRERAATLERQLEQVEGTLGVLAQRLPELDSGVNRLAERLKGTAEAFERVEGQVSALQAQAPELALWLEGERQTLAQDLKARGATIGELGAEIAALQDALEGSRSQLIEVTGSLEQDLARAKQQGADLEQALVQVRATGREASELIGQADAEFKTTRDALRQRVDALLGELAEQADLAAQRSQDVVQRAETEATRQLQAATDQAIDGLSAAREAQLAALKAWASEVQAELERTQTDLIAGWRGMDQAVAERQAQALADLDRHAETLEARIQELLKALDVIVARSSG